MIDINVVKLKQYASVCSVLYVEDDELIREQTKDFLSRFFPDVDIAEDGQIGLDKYAQKEYDIIITDINMPNVNGIEMIETIKQKNYEQHIVVTSAYNDSEHLMKLVNLNIDKFVEKPFNNKQFLYVIYKISHEIYNKKMKKHLEGQVDNLYKNAQIVIDEIPIGLITLRNNQISMANKAFLEIGGFDSVDTLKLEMPDIGILFEDAKGCINAQSNEELIDQLLKFHEDEKKVRILKNSKTYEYKVTITKLHDANSYLLTFTDITAIHNALFNDLHTKLPNKKFLLEHLDVLRKNHSKIYAILLKVKNFKNIEKWYGKSDAIKVEMEFAKVVKNLTHAVDSNAFIGYFSQNNIIIFPNQNNSETIKKVYGILQNKVISSIELSKKDHNSEVDFSLKIEEKLLQLNTNDSLVKLETHLMDEFDLF
jgi:two-component system, cell cycle response regulator